MRIEIDLLDAFLIDKTDGSSETARVAQVRFQDRPRASWRKVNIVVESPSADTVLSAAAAWFAAEERKQEKRS